MNIRSFVGVGVFALSLQASVWACPDLSGNYACQDAKGAFEMNVQQQSVGGATFYKFNSNGHGPDIEALTDGKLHDVPPQDGLKDGKYKAVCTGDHLVADVTGGIMDEQHHPVGKAILNYDVSKSPVHALVSKVKGKLQTPYGDYPVNQTSSCAQK